MRTEGTGFKEHSMCRESEKYNVAGTKKCKGRRMRLEKKSVSHAREF